MEATTDDRSAVQKKLCDVVQSSQDAAVHMNDKFGQKSVGDLAKAVGDMKQVRISDLQGGHKFRDLLSFTVDD
jgi:uncharacterized protein YutE (UPF0331/DUF86 family)